jgi:hypothetical protein
LKKFIHGIGSGTPDLHDIKMDLKETGYGNVDWILLARDRDSLANYDEHLSAW